MATKRRIPRKAVPLKPRTKRKEETQKVQDSLENIEDAVRQVSRLGEVIEKSNLTRRAVVLLIQDYLGSPVLSRGDISRVLDAIPSLEGRYLKKRKD